MKMSDIFDDQPLIALHMYKRKQNKRKRRAKTPSLTWDPFGGMSGYSGGYSGKQMHGAIGHDS